MEFVYNNSCCLIPELIGECVTHTTDGYGHGIITSAYLHPQDSDKNIYIVIAFDNDRESTYFNLEKLLSSQTISFDLQNVVDKIPWFKKCAILELGKSGLIANRLSKAKKQNECLQKYFAQKAAEKKAKAEVVAKEKQRQLEHEREEEEKRKLEERKRQLELKRKKLEKQLKKEAEEEKAWQEEMKQLQLVKNKAQDKLDAIPSSYMLVELARKDTYIIVMNNSFSDPAHNIIYYQDPFARDLIGKTAELGTNAFIKVGEIFKKVTFYYANTKRKNDMIKVPTRSIMIKKNGGYKFSDKAENEEIVNVLLLSSFTKHYEFTRGTYNSENNTVYIDSKLFRDFIYKYGKPQELDIEFYMKKNKTNLSGIDLNDLNSESILKGYGYTVNAQNLSPHEYRVTLLKELVDLEILTTRAIVDHIDFCITTHCTPKDIMARSRWAEDRNAIIDYVENPERFIIPQK